MGTIDTAFNTAFPDATEKVPANARAAGLVIEGRVAAVEDDVETLQGIATSGVVTKAAVRAATTANGTLATAFDNASTIDGVTLATNDRILVKNQSSSAENGIYIVQASGAPVRATDSDSEAELLLGAVLVQEGSTLAGTTWKLTTAAPITVGSTALTWEQIGIADAALAEVTAARDGYDTLALKNDAQDTATTAAQADATAALAIGNGGLLEDVPTFGGIGDYTSSGTDGVGKAYFEAGETGLASVRWPLASNVTLDQKVTLVYRMTTVSAGTPYAQLRISGGSAMSSNVNLTADGFVHHVVLTATGTANQLFVNMNAVDGTEATIELVLIRGDMDADTATESGLVRTLQAFLQMYEYQVNELAGGVGDTSIIDSAWSDAEKHPLVPSTLYFIAGRRNIFYGRQMLVGRKRQTSIDVGIVNRSIGSKPGFSLYATPQAAFNTDDISNTSMQIEVADPAYPTKRFRRSVNAVVTPATGTGTLPITFLGDSKSASYWASLYPNIVSAGITVQDLGTRTVTVSAVERNYEGRAGWSVRDYIGKSRPVTYAPNPFLKTADAGDLAAKPDLCFGDTGSTVRESYTENDGLASYSIFSWETWATAQSLSTSAKFVAILQLGHNDQTNGASWLDDVELGHNHIVDDFLATFANGAIVVVQEGIKSGIDVSGDNGMTQWNTVQMPLAKLKMELFSGRESEGVYLVHSFLQENMDFNSLYTTDSTDSITGVQKNTLSDIIHPTGQTSREWVNAVLPVVLYLQANL